MAITAECNALRLTFTASFLPDSIKKSNLPDYAFDIMGKQGYNPDYGYYRRSQHGHELARILRPYSRVY